MSCPQRRLSSCAYAVTQELVLSATYQWPLSVAGISEVGIAKICSFSVFVVFECLRYLWTWNLRYKIPNSELYAQHTPPTRRNCWVESRRRLGVGGLYWAL